MKLKLIACLVMAGALTFCAHAVAAPLFTPFLSVDINGANYGGGQTVGPTAAGFQPWNAFEGFDQLDPNYNPAEDWGNSGAAGLTKVFPTSEGNITANMTGVVPNSFRGARNRGANSGALTDLTQDFVFAQRDAAIAFGRNYIKLTLSGLLPNQAYEVTAWARDHFNGGADSFQSWTNLAILGGLDGPSAYMDANVAAGYSYQPAAGGVNNPIPKIVRTPVSGPDSTTDQYAYAATFVSHSDSAGVLTLYTWADPNTFSGVQGASLLNGFQIGVFVPEPASFALGGIGVIGLLVAGRRRLN
jgi:hypothetical protein